MGTGSISLTGSDDFVGSCNFSDSITDFTTGDSGRDLGEKNCPSSRSSAGVVSVAEDSRQASSSAGSSSLKDRCWCAVADSVSSLAAGNSEGTGAYRCATERILST